MRDPGLTASTWATVWLLVGTTIGLIVSIELHLEVARAGRPLAERRVAHLTWGNQAPPVKPEDVGARRR